MLKLENSIRGLSFSRVAFDLTIQDKKSGEFLFYVGSFLTGYSCVKLRYLYGYKERRGEFMMYVVLLCSGIYVLVQAIISA